MGLRRSDDLIQKHIAPGLDQERKPRCRGCRKIRDERCPGAACSRPWDRISLERTSRTRDTGYDVSAAIPIQESKLVTEFLRERFVGRQQPRFDFDLLRGRIEESHELIHSAELCRKIRYDQRIPSGILNDRA